MRQWFGSRRKAFARIFPKREQILLDRSAFLSHDLRHMNSQVQTADWDFDPTELRGNGVTLSLRDVEDAQDPWFDYENMGTAEREAFLQRLDEREGAAV